MAQSAKIAGVACLFGLLLPVLLFLIPSAPARGDAAPGSPVVARVYYLSRSALEELSASLDIWEVHPQEGYLLALLTPEDYLRLTGAGYQVVIDPARTTALTEARQPLPGQVNGIPGYPCYRTVSETYNTLYALAAQYSNLVELRDIGDSWDKITSGGPSGFDILAIVLTNHAIPGPKPAFFLMAEIHAREYATVELAVRFVEQLLHNYGSHPDTTWLLDHFEIHVVPMTNPDGRIFAEQGAWWRKNTDQAGGCGYPDYGVDLNRNHSFQWGGAGSSTNPCYETYRGSSAASEPEVQAIQTYVASLFPDQRGAGLDDPAPADATGLFISLHSYGRLVLWPWGSTSTLAPNAAALGTLGRKFAFFNSYTAQQSFDLYPTTGTSDDWTYGELGVAAYTFELGNNFFESCSYFENTMVPGNMPALIYAFKAARRPYQSPAGPEVVNIGLSPVKNGTPVVLSAQVNDRRTTGGESYQNITAARYSSNSLSWQADATLLPMSPVDGAWDSSVEMVTAQVCIAPGHHILFLEGKDAAGNWGVPSAIFLDMTENVSLGLTTDTPSQVGLPGEGVTYTLDVANTGNVNDTYTVTVSSQWSAAPLTDTVTLSACGQIRLSVEVVIPSNALDGATDVMTVTLQSQSDPQVTASVQCTTTAKLPPVYPYQQYLPLVIQGES